MTSTSDIKRKVLVMAASEAAIRYYAEQVNQGSVPS